MGDGNNAWIVVQLPPGGGPVSGVGFWTRTMTTSAQIEQVLVEVAAGAEGDWRAVGRFTIPDAMRLYSFDLPGQYYESPEDAAAVRAATQVRFSSAESSGGNTGARTVEVYACAEPTPQPTPVPTDAPTEPPTVEPATPSW